MFQKLAIAIFSLGILLGTLSANVNTSKDEESVRAFFQEFTDALNQGKVDDFASYWTKDGEIFLPMAGKEIEGNDKIALYLQNQVQDLKGKKIKFTIENIDFPDSDSATVEGLLQIFDQNRLVEQVAREVELVKQEGEWYLYTIREIKMDPPPSLSFNHLKDLQWLLGTWKDTDANVTIEFKTEWDTYKNFLKQRFTMEIYKQKALEGLQIIGWNPIDNKIVSWVFDSDGGYGNGTWEKTDEKWLVKLNYTSSDGSTASATNIYTPINDKNYTFSSIDRKVDGKALPNIDPVTVVKEE